MENDESRHDDEDSVLKSKQTSCRYCCSRLPRAAVKATRIHGLFKTTFSQKNNLKSPQKEMTLVGGPDSRGRPTLDTAATLPLLLLPVVVSGAVRGC